ncbi:PH domain-containing protein [Micromonospora sp. WMMA1363]|uniref:PH domain-containing protein n=1 Tax=Micromonospora sp. WMMA1363 TaxID=3053985 RepID=UPI00259C82E7|nr:PH domain-containing protein [Micromonospora sp. WMMA1363]MDM4721810.1 PH domain-containing protein [Micromonospora sp. WMMA1363]
MDPRSSAARQWRVPAALPAVKVAGAVAVVSLGLLLTDDDPARLVLAGVAAVALLAWAARDVLAPVRLAVDPEGLTVIQGFVGYRRLPWSQVEAITVERRTRLGLAGALLEIDAGASLHLFGRADLDADPVDVAEDLRATRPTP